MIVASCLSGFKAVATEEQDALRLAHRGSAMIDDLDFIEAIVCRSGQSITQSQHRLEARSVTRSETIEVMAAARHRIKLFKLVLIPGREIYRA
ncbi:hypothetical protein HN018_26555 (plasmid) [Lichenicola cladoniae]|uniref:Uncharacterized protein n=1 Tax=Lichenicola cladoniae TaxID=1484109 RepID=A0A6M8HYT2_9PROT|nr:hypothetical protein [Lichenicola cladoniae]NPD70236.1 hypothetical protein [Acetobacteraceae bacterium]QKE93699.1 hypothetical protein HN018_26555 [Lichenicola cladoniae]